MDNTNSMMERLDEFLLDVQKPSRYIGGETGSVVKEKWQGFWSRSSETGKNE